MEKKKQQNPKTLTGAKHEPIPQRNESSRKQMTKKQNPCEPAGKPYFEVADSVKNNACDQNGYVLTEAQKKLLEVQGVAIDMLFKAYNSMIELAAVRLECKLSNTRVTGVAKELKELIKVMSVYDC